MLVAQWVMNVLQFLTLVAVIWYTWETRRIGMRTARQYELEWKPQYHFSIRGLDPTSGTGRIKGSSEHPVELAATVVNLGRPALVVRGLLIRPEGAVGVNTNIEPVPVASGQAQKFQMELSALHDSLALCAKSKVLSAVTWSGKVSLAFWFEAGIKTWKSPEQFFLMDFREDKLVSVQQITPTEFHHLTRETPPLPEA
jgi:hypothetical protein